MNRIQKTPVKIGHCVLHRLGLRRHCSLTGIVLGDVLRYSTQMSVLDTHFLMMMVHK